MLRLILGRSGSGKSQRIMETAAKLISEGKKIIILIPEQASADTERKLISLIGASNAHLAEVLSFTRLCERIFRETGFPKGRLITDSARIALMKMAIDSVSDNLKLYSPKSTGNNMISAMLSLITEFKTHLISPQELEQIPVSGNILREKLKEISLIYGAFEALLANSGTDPLDELFIASEKLKNYNFFDGITVLADSFRIFTPVQVKMLKNILLKSNDLYVSLCVDPADDLNSEYSIFSPVLDTMRLLKRTANQSNVKIAEPEKLFSSTRFLSPAIFSIEQEIFRYRNNPSDSSIGIRVFSAPNPHEECKAMAAEIKRLVREENYRYRDITVIARNFDDYRDEIDRAMKKYNIPVFMDRRAQIDTAPLMRFVLTAVKITVSGFQTGDILKYLKTGITGFSASEVSEIENYAFLWDIRGKRWLSPFTSDPRGFTESGSQSVEAIEKIEALRQRLIAPLEEFCNKFSNKISGKSAAHAIFSLLEACNTQKNLENYAKELETDGENYAATEQARHWRILMDFLDELSWIPGENELSPKDFSSLFSMMISSRDMGRIPQGIDCVTAGAADRIRPFEPKIVWVLGLNEGIFPAPAATGRIITERERQAVIECGLSLAPPAEKNAMDERFLVYMTVASPSEKLYLSYPRMSFSGKAALKSEIIDEVKRIFLISPEDTQLLPEDFFIQSENAGFEHMAAKYRSSTVLSSSLESIYDGDQRLSSLLNFAEKKPAKLSGKESARLLFGDKMHISASKVEEFYKCGFMYFCHYGLDLNARKRAEIDPLEYGSLMHFLMESMVGKYNGKGLCALSEDQIYSEVLSLLEYYIDFKLGGQKDKSERFKYLFYRAAQSAAQLLRRIGAELAQSDFEPVDYELNINDNNGEIPSLRINIDDKKSISVSGFVDRVDIMKKNGNSYIRILDYKTGNINFDLNHVRYGLSIQMLIYLTAICRNGAVKYGDNLIPAGVLYLTTKRCKKQSIYDKTMPVFDCSGIFLNDGDVIFGMEKNGGGEFVPLLIKKGHGNFKNNVASFEEMGILVQHTENIIKEMALSLYDGDISAYPFEESNPCEYCNYSCACMIEEEDAKKPFEKLERDELFDVLKSIRESGENENGE